TAQMRTLLTVIHEAYCLRLIDCTMTLFHEKDPDSHTQSWSPPRVPCVLGPYAKAPRQETSSGMLKLKVNFL
ncbi:mCG145874, partial [Mus musculus]